MPARPALVPGRAPARSLLPPLICALLACSAASAAPEAAAGARAQQRALRQAEPPPAPPDAAAAPPPPPPDAEQPVNLTLGPTGVALTVEEPRPRRPPRLHARGRLKRNYTSKLVGRGVPRSEVENFIRTRLAVSAGCCRDACRFSLLLCGCEAGVVTLAMRLIGDPLIFNVLLQQMGLACGFSVITGDACPASDGTGGLVPSNLGARLRACGDLGAAGAGTDATQATGALSAAANAGLLPGAAAAAAGGAPQPQLQLQQVPAPAPVGPPAPP
ncbi:hypothetical protein Rsub_08534 [Raphidocelis subcapitata]|uniref:Uncharacterized protein n=1 Tax=Raphidocelis subcapitata TaxID=307507 RepID=A0A2V0PCC4_9CHLO|nr:hypothetical protein Rsub_08534 [Raphidocelis subcapitata]|eukprot:GBF95553.1 hypothetical protein Rsub_08534 [Raphidocelis subcapitata]